MIKLRSFLLFVLDTVLFWGSLILTLLIRYGPNFFKTELFRHLPIFVVIFILWIGIFELTSLYQLKIFKGNATLLQHLSLAFVISSFLSVILLYLLGPFLKITPKINLLFFLFIFFLLDYLGRIILNQLFFRKQSISVFFLGEIQHISEMVNDLKSTPQLGYEVIGIIKEEETNTPLFLQKADLVVVSPSFRKKDKFTKLIYYFLSQNIEVSDFRDFYETIYQKEPIEIFDENWFIERMRFRPFYEFLKKIFDVALSMISIIFFSWIILLCIVAVKISSPGPVFFKQKVFGKNRRIFTLYKIRTMKNGNEYPLWTLPGDKRITKVGKFLRATHLDELPQLYNILNGDLSFVGPRPERTELANLFDGKLPYYKYRNIVKPGLTGWAQINYKPSASIEEASEKLKYDFYYFKNRSFILDLLIIFKTIKFFIFPAK